MDWQGMCTFAAALAGLWGLCACLCAFQWTRRWVLALVEALSTKSKQRPAWPRASTKRGMHASRVESAIGLMHVPLSYRPHIRWS